MVPKEYESKGIFDVLRVIIMSSWNDRFQVTKEKYFWVN